ncbi:MAG TPA: roadblock/LC7 domain-containing protein, partial [Coriobacteriia bacterium]|nr:roadblock/LC7 domain-containing protein [Coriobacteriia bacterium]
ADELLGAPVVVPVIPPRVPPVEAAPANPAPTVVAAAPERPAVEASVIEALTPAAVPRPQVAARPASREEQLAEALDELMRNDGDIQAAALVSLDGFTMASALPAGMQADRVGAMSAAILGLGERAAAELGRGHLSQVFIEGENGYVLLIAAGNRAVLTAMAEPSAKLGLVLYDMKSTAERIGQILG